MSRSVFIYLSLLCLVASSCSAKKISVHGYVTAVHSPRTFEIDSYKVTDETAAYAKAQRWHHPVTVDPALLRIGLEVEVKGEYDRDTGELKAHAIKSFDEGTIESTGLVEKKLSLNKNQNGWSGISRSRLLK